MISRWVARLSVAALVGVLVLVPATASAQQASGIAGVVRDTSAGVLPGVTVEAASPALIERVRTVVTDGEGRYNIVDLRPGTYVVTFSLGGFNTVRREGIELTAGFTATVNADMQIGSLQETITVTGASPLVDTQNVRLQAAVSSALRAALPTGSQGLIGVATLVPGMTSSGLDAGGGGATGIYGANQTTSANFHGKAGSKQSYDGMQTNNLSGEGSTSYTMNPSTVQETTVEAGGISAESNASGLLINMVPKEGGNAVSGNLAVSYTNQHFQGDNLSDTLRARGVATPGKVLYAYDTNFALGGPIRKDRMWFFAATRFTGTRNQVAGRYFNKTQGTPIFTQDLDRPQYRQDWLRSQAARLTWQVSPKNKVNAFADPQYYMTRGTGVNNAPEANGCWYMWPQGLYQASWTSPVTNKFLLEGGVSLTKGPFPCTRENMTDIFGFTAKPTDISVRELSGNFRYNSASTYLNRNDQDRYAERFSASYITGSHAFKVGFQDQQHIHNQTEVANGDLNYDFTRGVPTRITQWATPFSQQNRTRADLGIYAQDQWAIKRLTLNYGVRFDYFHGQTLAQHMDAAQFVGPRDFAAVDCVPCWTDLNPRVGGSYDLFGTGRTALKASLGRYVGRETTVLERSNNPVATSINSASRTWNDANGNYIPDCDLRNFATNGECGPIDNVNFGKTNPNAIQFADDMIHGFGVRDYFWDLTAEVQHELGRGVSLKGGYYRNWSDHFGVLPRGENTVGVIDNLAVTPADFDQYCITTPVDPRLPGGGGQRVCGLYDVKPDKFGQGQLLVTRASHYGNGKRRHSDFFSAVVNTRLGNGIEFGASLDAGRTDEDLCFVVDSPQYSYPVNFNMTNPLQNCHVVVPFKGQTEIKAHAVYPLPGGFVVSGIFQNLSGAPYEALYAATNAEVAPSLGRNLAACGARPVCTATVMVPLMTTRTQFEARRKVLDLRLTKVLSVSPKARLRANLDIYNVLNDGSVLIPNNNYGSLWRQPSGNLSAGLMVARLIQFSGQLTF